MEKSLNKKLENGKLPFMAAEDGNLNGKLSPETMAKIKKEIKKKRRTYLAEFEITDVGGLDTLDRMMESYGRMREAQEILKIEGLTVINRFNEKKEHPGVGIERRSRGQFLLALKQLGLDVLPPNHKIGRPGGK